MATILENSRKQNVLVVNALFDLEGSPDFQENLFDVVYISCTDPETVKVILDQINPVTSNKCAYKPLFVSKFVEFKLGLYGEVVDGYTNYYNDPQVLDKTDEIQQNCRKYGLFSSKEVVTSQALFIRICRYLVSRNRLLLRPELQEKSSVGYCFPIFELFHAQHMFHLTELFGFFQILTDNGIFRILNFVHKIHLCPRCRHSHLMYVECCPKCGSSNLEYEEMIHHFPCANISPARTYDFQGQFRCPKCNGILRHIGVDYDRPAAMYRCRSCENNFLSPTMKAVCTWCSQEIEVTQLVPYNVYDYEITLDGARVLCAEDSLALTVPAVENTERKMDKVKQVATETPVAKIDIKEGVPKDNFWLIKILGFVGLVLLGLFCWYLFTQ